MSTEAGCGEWTKGRPLDNVSVLGRAIYSAPDDRNAAIATLQGKPTEVRGVLTEATAREAKLARRVKTLERKLAKGAK